jgi:hypothetical protein
MQMPSVPQENGFTAGAEATQKGPARDVVQAGGFEPDA